MVTSAYAVEEARRNLSNVWQRRELDELLRSVEVVSTAAPTNHPLFSSVELPDKDRPVLLAAIGAGATHLLTGDFRHFGPFYGKKVEGVLILPPGAYLSLSAEYLAASRGFWHLLWLPVRADHLLQSPQQLSGRRSYWVETSLRAKAVA